MLETPSIPHYQISTPSGVVVTVTM
jgi:hypothetical protein